MRMTQSDLRSSEPTLTLPNNPTRLVDRVSVHRPQLAVATEWAGAPRRSRTTARKPDTDARDCGQGTDARSASLAQVLVRNRASATQSGVKIVGTAFSIIFG